MGKLLNIHSCFIYKFSAPKGRATHKICISDILDNDFQGGKIFHLDYFLLFVVKADIPSPASCLGPRRLCFPEFFKATDTPDLNLPGPKVLSGGSGQVSPALHKAPAGGSGWNRGRRLWARLSRSDRSLLRRPPPGAPQRRPGRGSAPWGCWAGAGRGVGDFIPPLLPGPGEQ